MPRAAVCRLRVGVNRQKQIRALPIGDRGAFLERDELVGLAGEDDVEARARGEQLAQPQGDIQDQLRFVDAVRVGAGIVTAVTRVDDDSRDAQPSWRASE